MSLIRPGEVSALEPLADILLTLHDDRRKAIVADIERRKETGAPLDDDTRWPHVDDLVKAAEQCVLSRDAAALRKLCDDVKEATSSLLEDPGPLKVEAPIAGISIAMKVLTAREFRSLSSKEHRALRAQLKAMKKLHEDPDSEQSAVALELAGEATIAARRDLVAAVLAEARIDGEPQKLGDALLDVFERSGVLLTVYSACSAFQDLPWGKGERSGSRPRATSSASIAAPALSQLAKDGAATADP